MPAATRSAAKQLRTLQLANPGFPRVGNRLWELKFAATSTKRC